MEVVIFMGHECVLLENKTIQLLISRSVGPRILSLKFTDGENIFAELPDFVVECPGSGIFHSYGGHRLWHAPEEISRTYLPDDSPVEICPIENGYRVTQDVEVKTGLQKSMEIRLTGDARVVITHRLTNHGLWPVTTAPWAITQLKTGGVAILPLSCAETKQLPNRTLILWPYTDLSNPNVSFGKHHILLHVDMNENEAFKVGFPNPRGWLAYWLNGTLFVKHAKYELQSDYFDFGSSSECYCNDQFLELETLAPISKIEPGACVSHVETWELFKDIDCPRDEKDVQVLVQKLGLE
ncbi:MAG: hypothetical protein IPN58_08765 [Anaerolineales bacterium]|nr:hypothetical protein [Anaerolineales bacterium]